MLSQFVFHHAPGARVLRFVRKIPFLKGLSDNVLVDVAGRMTEESFEVSSKDLKGYLQAC
jgi:cGMP-dependent protein kinase